MGNKTWKAIVGFAAGIGTAVLFNKINKEINEIPSETGEYKDKAAKWLEIKKDNIKVNVDKKREQIKEITLKTKEALINEDSAEKRKEIIDKASVQIAKLNEEIKELIAKGSQELSTLANKISSSDMFANITEFFSSLKGVDDSVVDVDYTFEADYTEEDEQETEE